MSGELWVFGYGSLMWRPGFSFVEACPATLAGYRRCFCVFSTHHRGNARRPGLVLGLDRGGTCRGMAFRIAGPDRAATLDYLRAREQVNGVYRELATEVRLERPGHPVVRALAYVVERCHPSYAGRLSIEAQARLIRGATGVSGANLDYLINTLRHLEEAGIREPELRRVAVRIGGYASRGTAGALVCRRVSALRKVAASRPARVRRVRLMRPKDRRRFMYRSLIASWNAER